MHKTNVLTFSGDLWQRTFDQVALEYPDVTTAYNHVDAACIYCVESPQRYDVIVTDNLFGDILTDLGGAVAGGIGRAASGNLNPDRTGPSLFEPVHGSAPDIAGTGRADPTAAIISAAMMLDFLGDGAVAASGSPGRWRPCPPTCRRCRRPRSATPSPATSAQKGCRSDADHQDREDLDGWRAGRLGRRPHPHPHPHPPLRRAVCSRASGPTRPMPGPAVFRLTDHITRLFNSAKIFLIDIPFTPGGRSSRRPRRRCGSTGCPSATSGPSSTSATARWGSTRCPARCNVSIAVWPWGAYLGDEGIANGVRMKISSWQRHDPNAMPPAAKGTGMYINSSMAKIEALKAGYDEAILLSPQGYVSECTGENIFVVKGGRIITPPHVGRALWRASPRARS